MNNYRPEPTIGINIPIKLLKLLEKIFVKRLVLWLSLILVIISVYSFYIFYQNKLGLAYNDARSHLDIGRRVVEGLKPGIAQIGSVWLPLNHMLMVPFVWNDFLWHSGLAGAIWSMISFIATGVLIYKFLEKLHVGIAGRLIGVFVFASNLNILYLQSTAMTELLLLATMTAGTYYLTIWAKSNKLYDLIKSTFWIMASTMVRYDGWFLLLFATVLVAYRMFKTGGYRKMEGMTILFITLGAFGIALWVIWNLLIFNDPFYFALGPFSAHAQQEQLLASGNLPTKGNLWLSAKTYLFALIFNSYTVEVILGSIGGAFLFFDKHIKRGIRIMSISLLSPLFFNILALFLGFSGIFIQGVTGGTWFNVRYGVMLIPTFAIFIGYLSDKSKSLKYLIAGLLLLVTFFAFANRDAVTIDDANGGVSQKDVSKVSGWLSDNTKDKKGFILISAASHDAIIFSSGLPMKRFIHEGTGKYWDEAVKNPDKWARWIVLRTYDVNDLTWKNASGTEGFKKFELVESYPFADIYQIKPEYVDQLITEPIFPNQK